MFLEVEGNHIPEDGEQHVNLHLDFRKGARAPCRGRMLCADRSTCTGRVLGLGALPSPLQMCPAPTGAMILSAGSSCYS